MRFLQELGPPLKSERTALPQPVPKQESAFGGKHQDPPLTQSLTGTNIKNRKEVLPLLGGVNLAKRLRDFPCNRSMGMCVHEAYGQ